MNDALIDLQLADGLPAEIGSSAVRSAAHELGLPDDRADRLAATVAALMAEAREREVFDARRDSIGVEVGIRGDKMVVRVTDDRMPVLGAITDLESFRLSRLGYVDDMRLSVESGGNVAECSVRIPVDASWLGPEPVVSERGPRVGDEEAARVVVRKAGPDDADGIVRLTFRSYGYSYVDPQFYSPEAIARQIRSGTLHSYIATASDGEIVGHVALQEDPSGRVPEYSKLMVDPRYRGHGLAETMAEMMLEDARRRAVPGVWAECIMIHAASQRSLVAAGGIEVGLLIGGDPASVSVSGFDQATGRLNLMPIYIPLASEVPFTSYLPEHLIPMYRELAERIGLERTVADADEAATGSAAVEVSSNPGFGSARVSVIHPGADGFERVANEFRAMSANRLGVVYVDVPLAHPSAPRGIRVAERFGFFWAALLPCVRPDGDVLRLQRLGPAEIDSTHVEFASDHGRRMYEFVLAERERVESAAGADKLA